MNGQSRHGLRGPGLVAALAWFAACLALPASDAHASEAGLPLVQTFSPREMVAEPQNWALVQAPGGLVYAGNSNGKVLEFDGRRWRGIAVANRSVVRSLAVAEDGRIYVGANGEIGYLAADAGGRLQYISLMDELPVEQRAFTDVWRTVATAGGVWFSSYQRILRMDAGGRVHAWEPHTPGAFHKLLYARGRMFVGERGRGLLELVDDEWQLVASGEALREVRVDALLPLAAADAESAQGPMLAITREHALWLLDAQGLRPWPTAVDEDLRRSQAYSGWRLADGRIAIGTVVGGLFVLDTEGRPALRYDRSTGLPTNTVFALHGDNQGGLWLALGSGLARLQLQTPLTRLSSESGLEGSVYDLHRHAGYLHVAAHGAFWLDPVLPPRLRPIEGLSGQTWGLHEHAGELLAAATNGVYRIDSGRAAQIGNWNSGVFALHTARGDPQLMYAALKDGLARMRRTGAGWVDLGVVPGLADEVRTIVEEADGSLWLGTNTTGVLRLSFQHGADAAPRIERFGLAQGLPSLLKNWVYEVAGETLCATADGIHVFDEAAGRFVRDPRFAELFAGEVRRVGSLSAGADGEIMMSTLDEARAHEEFGVARRQADGKWRWDPRALRAISGTGLDAMRRIVRDAGGVTWISGTEVLYRHDARMPENYGGAFPTLVRRVTAGDRREVYGGSGQPPQVVIAHADNRLRFEFSAPSLDGIEQTRFQVRLDGEDNGWSPWSAEDYRDYDNLAEGDYVFRVRARNLYGSIGSEAQFAFRVLPPWWRSLWAWLGYALAATGLLWLLSGWRAQRLRAGQLRLQRLVDARTTELKAAHARLVDTQQQLVMQEKMAALGTLTAGVAHEINNPTNFADGAVQRLQQQHADLHAFLRQLAGADASPRVLEAIAERFRELEEMTSTAREGHERIKRIVADLRQFTRLDEAERKAVPVADPIQSTVNLVRTRFDRVRFELDLGYNPVIECQPAKLGQVFMNLVVNACEAIGELADGREGVVRIATRALEGAVEVVVEDNGAGMDDATRRRIFEPFFTTKGVGAGTGLGLAIVFGIVRDHSGGIEVESAPGQGTRFVIVLPLAAPQTVA